VSDNPDVINGVPLKVFSIRGATLHPFAGVGIHECVQEMLQFCLPTMANCSFVFNGRLYTVDTIRIINEIEDSGVLVPAEK